MLLQFGQHVADFSPFRHRRGLRIFSDSELMMLAYGLEHLKHFRVLLFGQKIYLEVEMVPLIRLDVTAVLTHEDEQREENRFQRDDRGQKLRKGTGLSGRRNLPLGFAAEARSQMENQHHVVQK